ncbi:valine--tRNA ligase [Alsobacter sp. SYSU M60028]|uniref:Valine--tRNA ligase n=1 Tax=Alsobacter ponti TaxID=2962936 RepID=A0ABT1LAS8_9HYPH|nr:valine--tRNA ligase [Alsobacter ponti]MCP8938580.1 valine--tRNA ligase [Alsobacter ponti]
MMDKTFDPTSVEDRIAGLWDRAQAFKAGRPDRAGAEPYCIVIPPPNVTGSLHMGHALNNTLQDVLCRFERMRGRDVLWQPGMDHAGIATQMVVERQLAERQQPDRRAMGREAFLARVWEWKAESGGAIKGQLQRLGASCDWSRERFTMDEGLSRAVLEVFVRLYKDGLIYRDKRLVNWDPKFQTAISDLEVEQKEVKGNLWHFRYAVEGSDRTITVATTRPETMLGDTAVAVHPDDERYRDLVGKTVVLPLVGRRIPIVADEYSDPEKGSGAVKITPAHDFNDFEVGRRHGLRLINVFDAEAKLDIAGNEAFLDGLPASGDLDEVLTLHGLDRFAARKRVIAMMEARGLLDLIEPNVHTVPHGDRSGEVIEPWLTDQWYVDAKTLAQPALAAVREGKTRFVPRNWEKTYFDWLENIEPWCVSRQLWWGHQIPAWYGPDNTVFVEKSAEEAAAAARAHYGRDVELRRDEDVLDTWFSSALWPFSTLGWPDRTPELARYYPTDVLVTGFDIIFFWVARMMMMGLHFMEEIPFHTVYIHALVRDEKGAKMSKSKGNVIDPLQLIDTYGADALRFTLAAMAAQGRDIKLSTQRVEGYRNFATKLWNAARFAEMNGCERSEGFDPSAVGEKLNRWALSEYARAVREVTAGIEAYRFNDAANAAYRFVWNVFCDWYLELAKPILMGEDGPAKAETRASIAHVIDGVCKILHPFMPFLTEELWAIKGAAGPLRPEAERVLALSAWPEAADFSAPEAEEEIGWLIDLVTEIRSARSETNVPAGAQIPLVLVSASGPTRERALSWGDMLKRLARLSDVAFADAAPAQSVQVVARGEVAALPLAGVVDLDAEKQRLAKELDRIAADVRKVESKLGNADFMARAPEEVVEEQRERLADSQARAAKIRDALARLSKAG